jgi:hypothetical protein
MQERQERLVRQARWVVGACLLAWILRQIGSLLGWWKGEQLSLWVTWGLSAMNSAGYLVIFLVFQLAYRGDWLSRLYWLVAGLMLETYVFLSRPYIWDFTQRLKAIGLGLGLTGLLAMAFYARRASSSRKTWQYLFLVSSLMFLYPRVSDMGLSLVTRMTPVLLDPLAWRMDRLWGELTAQTFLTTVLQWGIAQPLEWIYVSIPIGIGIALFQNFYQAQKSSFSFLLAYVTATILGLLGYLSLPMIGPLAVEKLTQGASLAQLWQLDLFSPNARNCTPSLHATWAILLHRCGCDLGGRWQWASGLFLFLTVLAIFPIGDHYIFDLLIAVPFSYGVYQIARWDFWQSIRTQMHALFGLATAFGWLWALRLAAPLLLGLPRLTQVLELLTLAYFLPKVCLGQEHDLAGQIDKDKEACQTMQIRPTIKPP